MGGFARDAVLVIAAQAVALLALRSIFPRLFYIDDKVAQYLPAFRYIGLQLRNGHLPVLNDPDLGMAGNFSADLQYGVLDPAHWAIALAVSSFGNLNNAGWFLNVLSIVLIGLGALTLLRLYCVRSALAIATATAVSLSGCVLWIGASWWPLTWGLVWMIWLWVGLRMRGWAGVLITGVSAWLLLGAGYPYAVPFAAVVVFAQIAEHVHRRGWRRAFRSDFGWRLLAGIVGAIPALPGLLIAVQMQPYSQRSGSYQGVVGNTGNFIPNLVDVIVGGSTLMPNLRMYDPWSALVLVPLTATAAFALPLVALIRWRLVFVRSGMITAGALLVAGLLATQLPEQVLSFRYSMRYLAITGFAIPIFLVLAARAGIILGRRRLVLAGVLVVLQLVFEVMRAPLLWKYHLFAAALALASVGCIALGRRWTGAVRSAVGAVLIATVALVPVLGAVASTEADRLNSIQAGQPIRSIPALTFTPLLDWATQVQEYQGRTSLQDSRDITAYRWYPLSARDWSIPVLPGNANLVAGNEFGFGYTSFGQAAWAARLCQDLLGNVGQCDDPAARMLEVEPITGEPWIDLMSADEVIITPDADPEVIRHFQSTWSQQTDVDGWLHFTRTVELPGRASYLSDGVAATAEPAASTDERFAVTTGSAGGRIVLRDTWWPAFTATLEGQRIPVTSLEGTLVEVELPPGLTAADLRIAFAPSPAAAQGPAWVIGVLGLAAITLLVGARGRRRSPGEGDPEGSADSERVVVDEGVERGLDRVQLVPGGDIGSTR